MKFKLKNIYLYPALIFLQGIKLKGRNSRARTKLVRLISPTLAEVQESEKALIKEFAVLDDDGNPVLKKDGQPELRPGTVLEFNQEHYKLFSEISIIEGGTYEGHREQCIEILDNYDGELSGNDAEAYDELFDALEAGED